MVVSGCLTHEWCGEIRRVWWRFDGVEWTYTDADERPAIASESQREAIAAIAAQAMVTE